MLKRWIPWKFIIRRTARAYGVIDPISFLARLRRFAQPSEVQEPIELLRAGIVFHARGIINTKAIQHNLDWVWPYWVERQFNPRDPSFIPRAFSVSHVNLTHRNWTSVGLPDRDLYPIVDPRGLVTPFFDGWSLDFWIVCSNGTRFLPSKNDAAEQELLFDPTLRVRTKCGYPSQFVISNVHMSTAANKTVLNIDLEAYAETPGWLVVSVRPYNPEGIQFVEHIRWLRNDPGLRINGDTRLLFSQGPSKTVFSNYEEGDVIHRLDEPGTAEAAQCKVGMATAASLFPLDEVSGRAQLSLSLPLNQSAKIRAASSRQQASSWSDMLSQTARLNIPDAKMQFLFDAAVRTLVLLSANDIVPGPYTYKRFWFRDACLMLNALLGLNLADRCWNLLQTFPERQKASGYFQSQEGEWDSNGQVLWIADRFQQLTGNRLGPDWKKAIDKGALWIIRKRIPESEGSRHAGLLPAGFSAEHLGPNDYYYWDNFWAIAGLLGGSRLMARWGHHRQSQNLLEEARNYEQAVERSLEQIPDRKKRGGLPASPYRRLDAGAIGSLVADYPLQLRAKNDPQIAATVEFMLANCFHAGGFFQDMIHSGINAYLTLAIGQTLLRNEDPRYRDLVTTVADLASPTGQWPEAIHPITKGGCMGDGQHGWAAAEWVMMLRSLFVREEAEGLILGSGIFPEWLQTGRQIGFGPTPTPFGPLSLTLLPGTEEVALNLDFLPRADCRIEARVPGCQPVEITDSKETISLPRSRS